MNLTKPKKRETWLFDIEDGLQYHSRILGTASITFFEGRFEKAEWPFKGIYTLDELGIVAQIYAKAVEIEKQYSEGEIK